MGHVRCGLQLVFPDALPRLTRRIIRVRFDLTDLRLFLAIVRNGSITRGSEAIHLVLASCWRMPTMDGEVEEPPSTDTIRLVTEGAPDATLLFAFGIQTNYPTMPCYSWSTSKGLP